ncbi:MAG: CPBP family intramembrane glutamic endopeptidase [Flavobacteriaceae bacterium]
MKALFKSQPSLSFVLVTFLITFLFWFLPVWTELPKDIGLALMLMGGCGPLVAGYLITVVNSGSSIKVSSWPLFLIIFMSAFIVLVLRLYLIDHGMNDVNGKMPALGDVGPVAYILFGITFVILGLNVSNALNTELKENYIKSFLMSRSKIKWYIIAIVLLPVMSLVSYFLGKAMGMETTDYVINADANWLVGLFSTFFFFGGNEEFGWRGFLQKEMQKKYAPILVVLVISILWSFWHLPLHYNGFYSTGGFMDLLPRFIFTIPITIVFSWLYNKSAYSVLALVILHSMLNNNGKLFGASNQVFLILVIALCIYCIIDDKMWKKKAYHQIYEA